jgi:FkbM family methyltransferase
MLLSIPLLFGISEAQDIIGPIDDAIAADERALDALFLNSSCHHVYLDLGTNRAVQIRKLYQPHLYPNATVLHRFDQLFGSAPRCHVCAIGFEPNPHHKENLNRVEKALNAAGAPVLIFRAAASDADSIAKFALPSSRGRTTKEEDWTASMSTPRFGLKRAGYLNLKGETTVRTVDISRMLQRVHTHVKSRSGGKIMAKFDCEGAELRIIPHLLQQQTLCLIDFATIEWHEKMLAAKWFQQSAYARKIPRTRSGVLAATSMVNQTRVLIETTIQTTGCGLEMRADEDDESYLHDGAALPNKGEPICR